MSLRENHEKVMRLISSSLFGDSSTEADPSLIPELIFQAVLPLALPNHKLSASIIAQNMQISYEHTELNELLTKNHIPYVVLKGVASASYYPNPILRTMGDVDFLIDSSDFPWTAKLPENIGFEKGS